MLSKLTRKLIVVLTMMVVTATVTAGTVSAAPATLTASTVSAAPTNSAAPATHPLSADKTAPAPGGNSPQLAGCDGPFLTNGIYYWYCTVLTTSTFLAFCSDGWVGGFTLPPGLWTIYGSCSPAVLTGWIIY